MSFETGQVHNSLKIGEIGVAKVYGSLDKGTYANQNINETIFGQDGVSAYIEGPKPEDGTYYQTALVRYDIENDETKVVLQKINHITQPETILGQKELTIKGIDPAKLVETFAKSKDPDLNSILDLSFFKSIKTGKEIRLNLSDLLKPL